MDRFEQLVLSGDFFRPASPSPPRTPETLSPASSRSASPQPLPAQEQIGLGVPGRTGVKGVIRDHAEAQGIEREKKEKEAKYRRERAEQMGRGALSWREEEEQKERLAGGGSNKLIMRFGVDDPEKTSQTSGGRKVFGHLREVGVGGFVQAVEERDAFVVVHIYDPLVDRCATLDTTLSLLARDYPHTKFLRARASALGFASLFGGSANNFDPTARLDSYQQEEDEDDFQEEEEVDLDVLPTVLVYRAGDLVETWVRVDWEAKSAGGVEQLLMKNGILKSSSTGATEDQDDLDWD